GGVGGPHDRAAPAEAQVPGFHPGAQTNDSAGLVTHFPPLKVTGMTQRFTSLRSLVRGKVIGGMIPPRVSPWREYIASVSSAGVGSSSSRGATFSSSSLPMT